MINTMTLTDFLLARITEDQAAVEGATHWSPVYSPDATIELTHDGLMIAPARVLAECEAKRRIVEDYVDTAYIEPTPSNAYDLALFHVMCDLATVYADHPDYREEWRP